MSVCLDAFENQLTKSPELIDRFFKNGKFDVDALLAGAKDLGYELEDEDLTKIDDEIQQKPLTASVSYLFPDAKTGEIREMTINEVELVAAGMAMLPDYSYSNININISAAVAVVAIAIIILIMIG